MAKQYKTKAILYAQGISLPESGQVQHYEYFARLRKHLDSSVEVWTLGTSKALFSDSISLLNLNALKEEISARKEDQPEVTAS